MKISVIGKIFVLAGIALIIVTFFWFRDMLKEKVYCGTITNKIDATRYGKHNAYADPILIVNFDGVGKREIHPNWITYTEHGVGDRVCFEKRITEMEDTIWGDGGLASLLLLFGFIGGIILIITGFGAFTVK